MKNSLIVIFIFFCVGFAIYSNILHAFFIFDDSILTIDPTIRGEFHWDQLNKPRSIGYVTFILNYRLDKLNPFGYHLLNIIIHIMNAVLVFFILSELWKSIQINNARLFSLPFFIALLFLVHPIQTQAVSYIIQRFASLAAFFTLISIYFYLKFRSASSYRSLLYIISLASALLAFKTKENTATLPFIIIAIELILFKERIITKEKIFHIIPYFLLIAVIPLSFINVNQPLGDLLGDLTKASYETQSIIRSQYFMTEFRVIITYLRLLIIPVHQSIGYYYPLSQSFFEASTFFAFLVLSTIFVYAFIISRKYPIISFGILWFFIFLAIESSIIPIKDVIFEHRLYLPSIGFFICIGSSFALLAKKIHWNSYKWAFVPLIIALSVLTYERNEIWKDELALWQDATFKYPQDIRNHFGLAKAYIGKNMIDEAIRELETYIPKKPNIPFNHGNLAYCYLKKGMTQKAIDEYKIAIAIDPKYIRPYPYLAMIYLQQNNMNATFELLHKAYSIDQTNPEVNAMLGNAYCQTGNYTAANYYFDQALKNTADPAYVYYNKAGCLFAQGKLEESRTHFFNALKMDSKFVDSAFYIAVTYEREGNINAAVHYYELFLSHSPNSHPLFSQAESRLKAILH